MFLEYNGIINIQIIFKNKKFIFIVIFGLIRIAYYSNYSSVSQQFKYLCKKVIQLRTVLGIFNISQVAIQEQSTSLIKVLVSSSAWLCWFAKANYWRNMLKEFNYV